MSTDTQTQTPDTTTTALELPAGTVARFHVTPAHLDRALRIAVLAASTDQTLPILNAVALTWTGANVAAMSTDRYRLVYALVETVKADSSGDLPHVVEPLETPAIMPLADVKTLLSWVKPLIKTLAGWGTLTVSLEGREQFKPGRLVVESPAGGSYVVSLQEGEYPKLASLLYGSHTGTREPVERFALNPTYMESVAKMAKLGCERNQPVELIPGATASKPVHFRGWSDGVLTFHGLIMPVRIPDTGRAVDDNARI